MLRPSSQNTRSDSLLVNCGWDSDRETRSRDSSHSLGSSHSIICFSLRRTASCTVYTVQPLAPYLDPSSELTPDSPSHAQLSVSDHPPSCLWLWLSRRSEHHVHTVCRTRVNDACSRQTDFRYASRVRHVCLRLSQGTASTKGKDPRSYASGSVCLPSRPVVPVTGRLALSVLCSRCASTRLAAHGSRDWGDESLLRDSRHSLACAGDMLAAAPVTFQVCAHPLEQLDMTGRL